MMNAARTPYVINPSRIPASPFSTLSVITPVTPAPLVLPEALQFDCRPQIPAIEIDPIFAQPADDTDIVRFGVEFAWSRLHRDANGDLAVRLHFLNSYIIENELNESLAERLCQVRLFKGSITPEGVVYSPDALGNPYSLQMLFDIDGLCRVADEMASHAVYTVECGECPDMDAGDYEEYRQWKHLLTFIDDLPRLQVEQFDTCWTSWSQMRFWADKFNSSLLQFWSEAMLVRFEPATNK